MKRLLLSILCLALLAGSALGLGAPEEIEDPKTDTYITHALEHLSPEELFSQEKARAEIVYLLPEEDRLEEAPYIPRRWTDNDVTVISRMVWGEARGVSRNEQKLVVWTVINRLENGRYGSTLIGVVRARGQFHGYSSRHPVTDAIRDMVIEVLEAWDRGESAKIYPPFARTANYLYFHGDGRHNWFRARHR